MTSYTKISIDLSYPVGPRIGTTCFWLSNIVMEDQKNIDTKARGFQENT
jgi:hypothetical protein